MKTFFQTAVKLRKVTRNFMMIESGDSVKA